MRNAFFTLLPTLLLMQGCYASTGAVDDLGDTDAPLVMDQCVATASPWYDPQIDDAEPGHVVLWINYPRYSPEYQIDAYAAPVTVEIDEELDARIDLANPRWETSRAMVLGRREGDAVWRVQPRPDTTCPARPAGFDWPQGR